MVASATPHSPVKVRRSVGRVGVLVIATVVCMLEGYDLAIWGASVPAIMKDADFGLTVASAGSIGALVSVGMLVGAILAGALVHRVGQLALIGFAIVVFSIGMIACAVAPNPDVLGMGRLVVGLGLGVVLPTVNAYTADLSRVGRIGRNIGITMAGYGFGALCAPLLTSVLHESGFRWLYVIGVVPALVVLPLLRRLPESPAQVWRRGRREEARESARRLGLADPSTQTDASPGRWLGLGALFQRGVRWATLLFWVMSFCGLLLVFGISAWLTTILQYANYPIGNALMLTAAMWLGVIVGVVVGGRIADVIGAKAMVMLAFVIGAVGLALMSLTPPEGVMYVLMFFSGFGFIGAQIMSNALIVTRYPAELRSNGISWALAIGRAGAIVGPPLGAAVIASDAPMEWNFYSFAIPAAIGLVAAFLVPKEIGPKLSGR